MPKQHVLFPTQGQHFLVYIGGPACLARISLSTLLFWLPQTLLFLEQTVLLEVIACVWKASDFLHCLPSLFVYLDQFRYYLSLCPPQTLPGNFQVSPCSLCLSIVSQRFFYYTPFFYYTTLQQTSQSAVRSMKKAAESYFPGVSMSQHGVWAKSLSHVVLWRSMSRTPSCDGLEKRPQANKERCVGILTVSVLSDKEHARGISRKGGKEVEGLSEECVSPSVVYPEYRMNLQSPEPSVCIIQSLILCNLLTR